MREIKFRAWDTFNKKWLDQKLFSISCCNGELLNKSCGGYIGGVEIQQFTGLKDKNGKEIYEGDILSIDSKEGGIFKGVITYDDKRIGFKFNDLEDNSIYSIFEGDNKSFEVIGNIFENKELLTNQPTLSRINN